jgi:hypothetical protein
MALDRANYQKFAVTPRDDWYVGMDVGQSIDPSAIAAVQHVVTAGEWVANDKARTWKQEKTERFLVRHIERLPLQTPYPAQVSRVTQMLGMEPLCGAKFGIDFTGCGRPVADAFRYAGLRPTNILILHGNEVTQQDADTFHVPKLHLCSLLETALHYGQLKVAPELPDAEVLKNELRDFNRKVSETGHVTYNAKVGKHDDEIIAVCLCLFMASRRHEVSQEPLFGH